MLKNIFLLYYLGEIFSFFNYSGLSPGSALFMVASSTVGIHPAAVNVDEIPSFTNIYGFIVVQTARCDTSGVCTLKYRTLYTNKT